MLQCNYWRVIWYFCALSIINFSIIFVIHLFYLVFNHLYRDICLNIMWSCVLKFANNTITTLLKLASLKSFPSISLNPPLLKDQGWGLLIKLFLFCDFYFILFYLFIYLFSYLLFIYLSIYLFVYLILFIYLFIFIFIFIFFGGVQNWQNPSNQQKISFVLDSVATA